LGNAGPDRRLDITGEACPITFVHTKLVLEEMQEGEVLEVLLDEGEPVANVPRSVTADGHQVLSVEKMGDHCRLLIKRGPNPYI